MTVARIEARGSGSFAVSGDMSFATVPTLWAQSRDAVAGGVDAIEIDLSAVERADSAGLALLVAWTRAAHRDDKAVRYVNPPAQLLALAEVNKLGPLLNLEVA